MGGKPNRTRRAQLLCPFPNSCLRRRRSKPSGYRTIWMVRGPAATQATHHLNAGNRLNAVWIAFQKEKGESRSIRRTLHLWLINNDWKKFVWNVACPFYDHDYKYLTYLFWYLSSTFNYSTALRCTEYVLSFFFFRSTSYLLLVESQRLEQRKTK